ncbi:EF-hand domain-containing protein [Rhodobacter sp. NSM]|uniref:EF-hand domain-containing protein n=1 Tax=Rhodobacter sp. NSM TaxID=3457501 RepID=UPI003FD1209A
MNSLHSALALALSVAVASPMAAQTRSPGEFFLGQWDADGNDRVTFPEARERRLAMFDMFDQSGDGLLDPQELAGIDDYRQSMREAGFGGHGPAANVSPSRMLRRFDADRDGNLSASEFEATLKPWFSRMDRNGDGEITAEDFGPRR